MYSYSKHGGRRARPWRAAAIGGPFSLVNSADGTTFTEENLKAGAYTPPLLNSTSAVPATKTPPKHSLNNP